VSFKSTIALINFLAACNGWAYDNQKKEIKMGYTQPSEDDFVTIRDFPFWSIMKLSFALAFGATLFLCAFHIITWLAGWPGPYLWFGSENRLHDIVGASFSIGFSVLFVSAFGAGIIKFAARLINRLNFRIRIR
jgi:hypothetical protein